MPAADPTGPISRIGRVASISDGVNRCTCLWTPT